MTNTIPNHLSLPLLGLALGVAAFAPSTARADAIDCYAPTVTITAPADGAMVVEGEDVAVSVAVVADGADQQLAEVYVLVDGEKSTAMAITASDTYTLQVPLGVGEHELVGAALDACGGEGTSAPITITVTAASGEGTAGEGGDAGGTADDGGSADGPTDGASSSGDDDDDDKGGCSVPRVPTRSWVGMSALLLTVVGASRLRRRAG